MNTTMPPGNDKQGCTRAYTLNQVMSIIATIYAQKRSLRRVAKENYNGQVNHADIQRILQGRGPMEAKKRLAFGLPALIPVPACPKCGEGHVTKRCTANQPTRHRDLFSLPVSVLRRMLEERVEYTENGRN